jgi:hypothetical protein
MYVWFWTTQAAYKKRCIQKAAYKKKRCIHAANAAYTLQKKNAAHTLQTLHTKKNAAYKKATYKKLHTKNIWCTILDTQTHSWTYSWRAMCCCGMSWLASLEKPSCLIWILSLLGVR